MHTHKACLYAMSTRTPEDRTSSHQTNSCGQVLLVALPVVEGEFPICHPNCCRELLFRNINEIPGYPVIMAASGGDSRQCKTFTGNTCLVWTICQKRLIRYYAMHDFINGKRVTTRRLVAGHTSLTQHHTTPHHTSQCQQQYFRSN